MTKVILVVLYSLLIMNHLNFVQNYFIYNNSKAKFAQNSYQYSISKPK